MPLWPFQIPFHHEPMLLWSAMRNLSFWRCLNEELPHDLLQLIRRWFDPKLVKIRNNIVEASLIRHILNRRSVIESIRRSFLRDQAETEPLSVLANWCQSALGKSTGTCQMPYALHRTGMRANTILFRVTYFPTDPEPPSCSSTKFSFFPQNGRNR